MLIKKKKMVKNIYILYMLFFCKKTIPFQLATFFFLCFTITDVVDLSWKNLKMKNK